MKAWWIVVAWFFFAAALWASWAHDPWLIFVSLLNAVTATRAGATEVRYRKKIRKLQEELGRARYHQDLPEECT